MSLDMKNMPVMTTYDSIACITIYLIIFLLLDTLICSQVITIIYKISMNFFSQESLAFYLCF